jgi:menaquinol-cytochrome c reductase iron-sulfur subunit
MEQEPVILEVNPKETIVINRRSFFGALLSIGAAGMGAILAVPVLRYALYPLYAKSNKNAWSPVGEVNSFSNSSEPVLKPLALKQLDGWREVDTSQTVYVIKSAQGELGVLSSVCPHMGCTIAWHAGEHEFYCPCHGSVFTPDGKHVSGPSPRDMDPLPHKIVDGKLLVNFEYFRENVPNQEVLS